MSETVSEPLVRRAARVREKAAKYDDLRTHTNDRRDFEEQRDKFQEPALILQGLDVVRGHLSAEGVVLHPPPPADVLSSDLRELAGSFREKREVMIEPRSAKRRQELYARLQNVVQGRHDKTLSDWADYVEGLVPPIASDVLDVLEQVPPFREAVRTIRREMKAMREASESLPDSQAAIVKVRQRAAQIEKAWDTLGGEGLPDEVFYFLRDAGKGGADLRLLTEGVLQWLHQHDLEGAFAITMRVDESAASGERNSALGGRKL